MRRLRTVAKGDQGHGPSLGEVATQDTAANHVGTGGAGNDDEWNGDVCVCVLVLVPVRRHVLRCWSAPHFLAFPQLLATPWLWFCGSCRCRGSFVAGFALYE